MNNATEPPTVCPLVADRGVHSLSKQEFLISGMKVLLPSLVRELHIPSDSQTWPASGFTLVAGAFLLPFGRLCDFYGASIALLLSVAWLSIWTLVGGFSRKLAMFLVTGASQC